MVATQILSQCLESCTLTSAFDLAGSYFVERTNPNPGLTFDLYRYADRGIPLRRGYLLYVSSSVLVSECCVCVCVTPSLAHQGVPGGGKTSLIGAMAGELDAKVFWLSLATRGSCVCVCVSMRARSRLRAHVWVASCVCVCTRSRIRVRARVAG